MAKKGQTFNHDPHEMKVEAIRLHVEEGWTYRRIMEHLDIPDRHLLKVWMKKYKQLGEFGLLDQRGRREEYVDQQRYVQKLKRENQIKKVFENLDEGGVRRKYETIEKATEWNTLTELCTLFSVSRSGYYAYKKRKQVDRDKPLKDLVQAVYQKYDGKYGYRQTQLLFLIILNLRLAPFFLTLKANRYSCSTSLLCPRKSLGFCLFNKEWTSFMTGKLSDTCY